MNNLPKRTTITLSIFSLPILLAILVVSAASAIAINKDAIKSKLEGMDVLSKSDSKEGDSGGNESEDKSNDDEKKTEDSKKEVEKKEVEKKSNSGSSAKQGVKVETKVKMPVKIEDSSREVENEVENEAEHAVEKESEDGEKAVEISSVNNDDGTVTKTFKKTEGSEVKTRIVVLNADGKEISKTDLHEDGTEDKGKTVVESTVTNPDGTITKIFKKVEGDKTEIRSLTYSADGKLVRKTRLNDDGSVREEEKIHTEKEVENETSGESSETEDDNPEFKLTFMPSADGTPDPALSSILKAKLKQEVESEDGLGTSVSKLELEIKTTDGKLKYEGKATKTEKLFGILGVDLESDVTIDPVTGKITQVSQTFWTKVLDFFSK